MKRKPMQNSMGVSNVSFPRHIVAIQLKNFTPVGTAIKNDVNVKKRLLIAPLVNMWCAHTEKLYAAISNVANTNPRYPNTGLREKTGMISVTIPKKGRMMMYTSGCPK